ncbi:MAG TPA: hydrogenase accessory protein HypB, partial [Anaerolineae bacterium]|nr:hydrogenase accessory protein HypB [Anaerolineae bacterium]
MSTTQTVPVVENILKANDQLAQTNRALLDAHRTFAVNFMASPGAGKTTLIVRTIHTLKDRYR